MVKVEEIKEKDTPQKGLYANSEASSSSSSISSVSTTSSIDDDLPEQETFFDRVTALVDIVPPKTRAKISERVGSTINFLTTSGKIAGNLVWIVTTSALLVGLPLALSFEEEAAMVAREREMEGQREGQAVSRLVRCWIPS